MIIGLMILAVICFGIQVFAGGEVKGIGVGWLGLLFWAFGELLGAVGVA